MLVFRCEYCHGEVRAMAVPGDRAVCRSCNTRQMVPADAHIMTAVVTAAGQAKGAIAYAAPGTIAPKYGAAEVMGIVLITLAGLLTLAILVIACIGLPMSLLVLVYLIFPVLLFAIALLLFMVRDIAISVWHSRAANNR